MTDTFLPPLTPPDHLMPQLRTQGYAVLGAAAVAALAGVDLAALRALEGDWADLPPDLYLKDGGRYRRRRHACFVVDPNQPIQARRTPDRAHWQPVEYNALHGGMQRWFQPIAPETIAQAAWSRLLLALARTCSKQMAVPRWHVEAHQFRIDTTDGLGRPTPEGAHRDGVDFVAVLLVGRHRIKGGETRIFEADGPQGLRFTLEAPWSLMLMDDPRVIHESTPIQPLDDAGGHRDTLVLTFRANAFLGDDTG